VNKIDKRIAVFTGKALRSRRRAKDITLDKLALKLNVNSVTVGKYEKGKINIALTQYARWCRALKVDGGKLHNKAVRHAFSGK